MDLRPVRQSPDFRRLWAGGALSAVGGQMTAFAVALQVFTMTQSPLAVGGVGLAMGIPAVIFGLAGGSIVDSVDRRKLVLVTSCGLAAVSALFAIQAYVGNGQLWILYALVATQSAMNAVNAPARRTFLARLLAPELVPAGAALTVFTMHLSLVIGPTLAGLIAASAGLPVLYLIDLLTFGAALYGIVRLPAMKPEFDAGGDSKQLGLSSMAAGLRFIGRSRLLTGVLIGDICATVLGMPIALFPALNAEYFGGGARTLGLLSAALAVGGVLGSVFSGPAGQIRRPGLAMLITIAAWGCGLTAFGLVLIIAGEVVYAFGFALAALVFAGAADVLSVIFRTGIIQLATPDHVRGRVSAVEFVVGAGCPHLGNFRAGAVGSATTPAISAVAGGVATLASAVVLAVCLPAMRRHRSGVDNQLSANAPH